MLVCGLEGVQLRGSKGKGETEDGRPTKAAVTIPCPGHLSHQKQREGGEDKVGEEVPEWVFSKWVSFCKFTKIH